MSSTVLNPLRYRAHSARGAVWLIVLALLTVQTLGLLHGVAHPSRSAQAIAEAQCSLVASVDLRGSSQSSPAKHPSSWLEAMFSGHGGQDCKAFDQASHADAAASIPLLPLFAPPAEARASVHIAWHLAAQARGFLARGPPVAA